MPPMNDQSTKKPTTVSLADEEGVKQILTDTPLVFTGHMWQGLVDWAAEWMLRPGFELANAADMQIPQCVENVDQAIAIIQAAHARWEADGQLTPESTR